MTYTSTNGPQDQSRKSRGTTSGNIARDLQSMVDFDDLPNSAFVRVATIAGLFSVSKQTIYSWIRDSRWPAPIRLGDHCAVWSVDTVRAARAALISRASAS
jgi:predicted DNA-binding transcriptional regulator AlpA